MGDILPHARAPDLWQGPPVAVRGHRLLLALLGVLAIAVALMVIPAFVCRPADPTLDILSTVPAFSLVDDRGETFTEAGLRGHVSIVDFIFTRCDAICPTSTMKMEKIQDKTFDIGNRVKLVSFSVDPEYDTPPRLADYAKKYRADGERWRFITGPLAQIQALVEGPFMINMQRKGETASGAPNIAHQGFFLLMDGQLNVRGVYDSGDTQRLDEMIRDARYLARVGT
jgi:protein SCO1/2